MTLFLATIEGLVLPDSLIPCQVENACDFRRSISASYELSTKGWCHVVKDDYPYTL